MEQTNQEFPVSRIGSKIDLKTAAKWTRYSRQRQVPGESISQLFGRDIIELILSQKECEGIRIYYANSKPLSLFQRLILILINFLRSAAGTIGQDHLILVGVSSNHGISSVDQIPREKNQPKAITQPEPQLKAFNLAGSIDEFALGEQSMPCPASGCPSNELTGRVEVG